MRLTQRHPLRILMAAIFSGILVLGLAVLTLAHVSTVSAATKTLYVGTTLGNGSSCSSPGFTSVQAAVDASTYHQTIDLCGNTVFPGPVVVTNHHITILSYHGASIAAMPTMAPVPMSRLPKQFTTDNLLDPEAIFVAWGNTTDVTLQGVNIVGPLPTNNGCANEEYGILVLSGAHLSMDDDQVLNVHDSNASLYGCQFGIGIQIGRMYWPHPYYTGYVTENFVGHADITETLVMGYQKNGIDVDSTKSTATITHSLVSGAGRDPYFGAIIAQNGIEIARGASADVHDDTVSNNSYTGPAPASSGGIIVFGGCGDPLVTNITIRNNTLRENDVGIYANNFDPTCTLPPASRTNITMKYNDISNSKVTNVGPWQLNNITYNGYQAGIDDVGNGDVITENLITGLGYKKQMTANGPFVIPIDTITFPTKHVRVYDNP